MDRREGVQDDPLSFLRPQYTLDLEIPQIHETDINTCTQDEFLLTDPGQKGEIGNNLQVYNTKRESTTVHH